MKTPEEIKKGLERCKDDRCICDECEFSDGNVKKWRSLMGDALAYIEQLENHISLNTLCGGCDAQNNQGDEPRWNKAGLTLHRR